MYIPFGTIPTDRQEGGRMDRIDTIHQLCSHVIQTVKHRGWTCIKYLDTFVFATGLFFHSRYGWDLQRSFSVLMAIFQVNLVSRCLLKLRMMEVVVTTWLQESCKAPVKSSPTNQHPVFLQTGCPSCRPTNSVKAMKGNPGLTRRK